MILGFKEQFVEPILSGSKIHTIRRDQHDRWKSDNIIHFATGVRTQKYKQFHESVCISVQSINIYWGSAYEGFISINNEYYESFFVVNGIVRGVDNNDLLKNLSRNDGFPTIEKFFKWFNKDYEGKIIHWTDFKY